MRSLLQAVLSMAGSERRDHSPGRRRRLQWQGDFTELATAVARVILTSQ